MFYQISEQLISLNRSHQTLNPQGFVIHSTDTPNATSQNEHDYFNTNNVKASVHYFADWTSIIRTVPENEIAWGCGKTGNSKYLQIEMCQPVNNPTKFQEVWNRTVWLVANICVRYGWNTSDNVFSHRGISNMYHETDHQDPIEFLASYGKTWDQLLSSIDNEIANIKGNNNNGGNELKLDTLVLYFGDADLQIAADLAQHFQCPIIQSIYATDELITSATTIYQVGGNNSNSKVAILGGKDRFDTMKSVLHAMGKV